MAAQPRPTLSPKPEPTWELVLKRNPVEGIARDELFDAQPVVDEAAAFFYGNPEYSNLPRKHKITIAACADRCNAPEINCIALVGAIHEGRDGFAVRVGGGLSSVPRI